jgi:hypothetical protein
MVARAVKSRQDQLIEQAFLDPGNPAENILQQANGTERLLAGKLSQVELNLDTLFAQGRISQTEQQELSATAKAVVARNWLAHDGQLNEDGTVTYRGVVMDARTAPLIAYADAKRYWDKERHLSTQELGKAATDLARGVFDFFIGDDLKTLSDPHATLFTKVLAGGSLALNLVPGGALEKSARKILLRGVAKGATEKTLATTTLLLGAGLAGYAGVLHFSWP